MEIVYWHNIMPKNNVSLLTAPTNMIYRYQVWLRNTDMTALPE